MYEVTHENIFIKKKKKSKKSAVNAQNVLRLFLPSSGS